MKKTLILAAIGATATFCLPKANAADDLVVTVGENSSKFALASIQSLKFSGDKLQVFTNSTETPAAEFSLADITSLTFADNGTQGIETTTEGNRTFSIAFGNGILSAAGLNGARMAVYDLSGKRIVGISSWDGSAVPLQNVTNGVYVLTIDNQTFKFIKK